MKKIIVFGIVFLLMFSTISLAGAFFEDGLLDFTGNAMKFWGLFSGAKSSTMFPEQTPMTVHRDMGFRPVGESDTSGVEQTIASNGVSDFVDICPLGKFNTPFTMNTRECKTFNNKVFSLKGCATNVTSVSVNGVGGIIGLGQHQSVNGLDVRVTNIINYEGISNDLAKFIVSVDQTSPTWVRHEQAKSGDTFEYCSKKITLKGCAPKICAFDVNGVGAIISENSMQAVNGVKIGLEGLSNEDGIANDEATFTTDCIGLIGGYHLRFGEQLADSKHTLTFKGASPTVASFDVNGIGAVISKGTSQVVNGLEIYVVSLVNYDGVANDAVEISVATLY